MSGMANAEPREEYCIVVNGTCGDFISDPLDPAGSCIYNRTGGCPHLPEYQKKMRAVAAGHPNVEYFNDFLDRIRKTF